ncbi:MAG: AI-2E family transporter [Lagierella massiliensis]|nr:AI-2E family transporter [Lagierella massiliensis]
MNIDFLREFVKRTGVGFVKYLKAIVITSLINFVILLLGLRYIGVPYYGLIAFVIAVVDLMPILGSGIVLIPWSLVVLVQGNGKFALSLIVIYLITLILNQVLEPLILGKSIGLKPLYTLGITVIFMVILTPGVGAIVGALVSIMLSVYLDMKKNRTTRKDR